MMLDGKHNDAESDTERRVDAVEAIAAFKQNQPTPLGQCDTMLKVLSRDDTLRTMYVRRRWQRLTR